MLDLSRPEYAHPLKRLRTDLMLWLGSVRPDGRPHLVAVWFLWDGASVLILSKPENQKVRNLRQNPHVTLALDDTRSGEDVVVIEGTAELVSDPDLTVTLPAYAAKYAEQIARIFTDPEDMARQYSQAIRITPTRVR